MRRSYPFSLEIIEVKEKSHRPTAPAAALDGIVLFEDAAPTLEEFEDLLKKQLK